MFSLKFHAARFLAVLIGVGVSLQTVSAARVEEHEFGRMPDGTVIKQ